MTTPPRGPVDWARHYAAERETQAATTRHEAETLKAALGRVRKLAAELFVEGATHTHRSIGRQLLNALADPEPGHSACPGIRACADADRRPPLETEGE